MAKSRKTKGTSVRGNEPKLEAPIPRLKQVEDWLAAGRPHGEVVQLAMAMFQVSPRTAQRDIAKVYAKWEKEEAEERPSRRARMRAELWDLYGEARRLMKSLETDDEKERKAETDDDALGMVTTTLTFRRRTMPRPKDALDAARILERLCKLDGLDAPTKVEVAGFGQAAEGVLAMTPSEREKRIAELIAKREAAERPKGGKR